MSNERFSDDVNRDDRVLKYTRMHCFHQYFRWWSFIWPTIGYRCCLCGARGVARQPPVLHQIMPGVASIKECL